MLSRTCCARPEQGACPHGPRNSNESWAPRAAATRADARSYAAVQPMTTRCAPLHSGESSLAMQLEESAAAADESDGAHVLAWETSAAVDPPRFRRQDARRDPSHPSADRCPP